jgi:tRNA G10  N-methylase Trm11
MYQFFYKTGHCKPLSVAEFLAISNLTEQDIKISNNQEYIFSNKKINVERSGGLVFGGVILYTIQDFSTEKTEELWEVLTDTIEIGRMNGKFKKLGIAGQASLLGNILPVLKKAGSKKINLLKDQTPNFGHWKSTNDWILLIKNGKDLLVVEITSYADQELWAKLDVKLPHGDMKRGIINLKLARSLLNLTDKTTIWDPFGGQGRVLCGGLDLKQKFYISDIDEVCVPDVKGNVEYTNEIFSKKYKQIATLEDNFTLDAQQLNDTYFIDEMNRAGTISEMAIVTEGTLGYNFSATATEKDAEQQLNLIKKIWKNTISQAHKSNIEELVFCLPFYKFKRKQIIPDFLDELIKDTDYKFTQFQKNRFILYSRDKTYVGHCIIKLTK